MSALRGTFDLATETATRYGRSFWGTERVTDPTTVDGELRGRMGQVAIRRSGVELERRTGEFYELSILPPTGRRKMGRTATLEWQRTGDNTERIKVTAEGRGGRTRSATIERTDGELKVVEVTVTSGDTVTHVTPGTEEAERTAMVALDQASSLISAAAS